MALISCSRRLPTSESNGMTSKIKASIIKSPSTSRSLSKAFLSHCAAFLEGACPIGSAEATSSETSECAFSEVWHYDLTHPHG